MPFGCLDGWQERSKLDSNCRFGLWLWFQIIEDLGYVAAKQIQPVLLRPLTTISGGLKLHALHTAVVSVGVFLLLSQVTQQKEKLFGL